MNLITYEQLAKLRLRDFVPDPDSVDENDDWEWMDLLWHNESVGFTNFCRHEDTPDETGGVEISFAELPAPINRRMLSELGLPLRPGMSSEEVLTALGEPVETYKFVRDRISYDFEVGPAKEYSVSCTVKDDEGLIHVSLIRSDLVAKGESENESED